MKKSAVDTKKCDSEDIALKSFFLGPQAENSLWLLDSVHSILMRWFTWRREQFPQDGHAISQSDQCMPEFISRQKSLSSLIDQTMTRFEKELPKFSPRYIGHMFSEVSLPALLGHMITLLHNPNNISSESSRVGSVFESESLGFLNDMVGYPTDASGHFTSGGTIANFEALVRARNRMFEWLAGAAADCSLYSKTRSLFEAAHLGWTDYANLSVLNAGNNELRQSFHFLKSNPFVVAKNLSTFFGHDYLGPVLLVPAHAHYSWKKGAALLGLADEAVWSVDLDRHGRISLGHLRSCYLKSKAENRPILAIVTVLGTTELGNIDPVYAVQKYLDKIAKEENIHIWHHVDAAYGGFLCSLVREETKEINTVVARKSHLRQALEAVKSSTSLTLDPHKLGYVPYSSGAFLCQDERDYQMSVATAPYIHYSKKSDKGKHTLEGSRSAAGAVATWLTAKSIGLNAQGYGRIITRTFLQKQKLQKALSEANSKVRILLQSDTNIICFHIAETGQSLSKSNFRTLEFTKLFSPGSESEFFVSKTIFDIAGHTNFLSEYLSTWSPERDEESLVLVRLCLMNPFFSSTNTNVNFIDEFTKIVEKI